MNYCNVTHPRDNGAICAEGVTLAPCAFFPWKKTVSYTRSVGTRIIYNIKYDNNYTNY